MKKFVSILLTLSLLMGLMLMPAYAQAAGSKGPGGNSQQTRDDRPGSDSQPADAPADDHKPNVGNNGQGNGQNSNPDQGNTPDANNGKENNPGQNNGKPMEQVDVSALEAAIATVEDSTTAASLTALLAAYQTAAEGDDRAAAQSALQALLAAMETAELDTSDYVPVKKVAALLDTDRVSAAINALTDTDTAASLTALLTAYQTAVEGGDATAVKAALEALKDGLKDAGLMQSYDRASEQGQAMRTLGERYGRFLDVSRLQAAIDDLDDSLTAANLSTLLAAYEAAAAGSDATATRTALDALLAAMKDANIQIERVQEDDHGLNIEDGSYLDTDKVAIAISTLEDTSVAATLNALLSDYETALSAGDNNATLTAYNALLDAMEAAGLQV